MTRSEIEDRIRIGSATIEQLGDYFASADSWIHNQAAECLRARMAEIQGPPIAVPAQTSQGSVPPPGFLAGVAIEGLMTKGMNQDRLTSKELETRFTYHPPTDHQIPYFEELRSFAHQLSHKIWGFCPDCRERSLAITKLEEAVMWANAAIARRAK